MAPCSVNAQGRYAIPRWRLELVANCDRFSMLKHATSTPYAFTEHGALMLASVLHSPTAILVSIQIVRAFLRLREMLAGNQDLGRKVDELEKKYDAQFRVVFDAIRGLMRPVAPPPKRRIGFVGPAS